MYLYIAEALYELIDTWWDVNVLGAGIVVAFGIELIDTWWDVNDIELLGALVTMYRINRYMVGCKLHKSKTNGNRQRWN